ncbi:unnamed protein product [Sphagnum compactum]
MSIEPFRRLVRIVARAFYDEEIPAKGPNRSKSDKSDNRGIAVVILDALTRRQWVKEDDLAKVLRLHPKQLRRTLRVLEEEMLVIREHRRETVKGAKLYNAAIAAVSEDHPGGREGEEKLKVHTHSYCCIDYAQVYDIVRYRIHRAKKKIKDQLEDRNTIQEYICPNSGCGRRYSALDALRLVNPFDENFHCENCNAELVAESDKLAAVELGDGDGEDNARRRRHEKLKELLEKMDKQLQPLTVQLSRVKDLTPPDFGTLAQWEKRAIAAGRMSPNGEAVVDLPKASHGQGLTGTPMPFLGETKVEVALAGGDVKREEGKDEAAGGPTKVLPPWMIRQGMSLTAEQRGEAKLEMKSEDSAALAGPTAPLDVKPTEEDNEAMQKKIQEEYLKAYYAALLQRQQEAAQLAASAANGNMSTPGDSTVGDGTSEALAAQEMKMDGAEDEEEVEWEDATATEGPNNGLRNGGSVEETGAMIGEDNGGGSGEFEDEDEIDWEEG